MPATLLRFTDPAGELACYLAVNSADAAESVTEVPGLASILAGFEVDAGTVPWDALPGIRDTAAAALAGKRAYMLLGTTRAGTWTSWYLRCPAPPVPEEHL